MRRTTRMVKCGTVIIGGRHPVSIQSMTNTDTRDVAGTVEQILALSEAGCDIVRVAVVDRKAVEALSSIKAAVPVPIVADIHFSEQLAIAAMEAGADKIRINPGNIGSNERVQRIYRKAAECGIPVRIGVNAGSLDKTLIERHGGPSAQAMCESACQAVDFAHSVGFTDLVVSLKSSDVKMNHEAHLLFAEKNDIPLHIGLTEAGLGTSAEVKSSVAMGALLLAGIGDTMRISLTGDPLREVEIAKQILAATARRDGGIDFISCPTCGRTRVDLLGIAQHIEEALQPVHRSLQKQNVTLRLAVMGCEVNGPGEAAHADLGVACGLDQGVLFAKGVPIKTVPKDEIASELVRLARKISLAKTEKS